MSSSPGNYVAIDTNVFYHISNKQMNGDRHINKLLTCLKLKNYSLLVDNKNIIWDEYRHNLRTKKWLKKHALTNEGYLLTYWIGVVSPLKKIKFDCNDNLAQDIRQVIPEPNEGPDRVFVYVASMEHSPLISNDQKHIVSRRSKLLALCPHASDIVTSKTASQYCKQP